MLRVGGYESVQRVVREKKEEMIRARMTANKESRKLQTLQWYCFASAGSATRFAVIRDVAIGTICHAKNKPFHPANKINNLDAPREDNLQFLHLVRQKNVVSSGVNY